MGDQEQLRAMKLGNSLLLVEKHLNNVQQCVLICCRILFSYDEFRGLKSLKNKLVKIYFFFKSNLMNQWRNVTGEGGDARGHGPLPSEPDFRRSNVSFAPLPPKKEKTKSKVGMNLILFIILSV